MAALEAVDHHGRRGAARASRSALGQGGSGGVRPRVLRLRPAQPLRLPSRYHARPRPAPAADPDARPPCRRLRSCHFRFRDPLPALRDPRLTSRCSGSRKRELG